MKKTLPVIILSALMIMAMTVASFGLGSIGGGTVTPSGQGTTNGFVSKDVNTDAYSSNEVKNVVSEINAGSDKTMEAILSSLPETKGKTDAEEFPTTADYDVNINLYDRITGFYEVNKVTNGTANAVGSGTVTVQAPTTVGMRASDLLVMVLDQTTGEMYIVPLKAFDKTTGTLTFDMPCQGPYSIVHKLPLVVKAVDTTKYLDADLAKAIAAIPTNKTISLTDYLEKTNADNTAKLTVADGVVVKPSDYVSVTALADLAVVSEDGYTYDLNTKIKANLYRGNDKVDWEKILKDSGIEYDKAAIEKDPSKLEDIEPFVLKDSFVYHIDAKTGEVSIIYEPKISWTNYDKQQEATDKDLSKESVQYFNVDDIEEQNNADTKLISEEVSGLTDVFADKVYAETATDSYVCIVMQGDGYLGMGPFLLFMPKESGSSFPWWIILIVVAAGALIGYLVFRKKKA